MIVISYSPSFYLSLVRYEKLLAFIYSNSKQCSCYIYTFCTSFLNVVGYRSLNLTSRSPTIGRCTMLCYVDGHKYLLNSIYFNTLFLVTDLLCPPVWDHVMCWNSTEAGTTALQPCPNYIHRFLLNGYRYLFSKITFMKFQQICLKGQKSHLCRLALVS